METEDRLSRIKSGIELITPEIARNMLLVNTMNRKYSDRTVSFYADQMKRGLWTITNDDIVFSDTNKCLNGQHRLKAVIVANVSVFMSVKYNVPEEYFQNMDNGKKRSNGDVLGILGVKDSVLISAGISRYFGLRSNFSSRLTGGGKYSAPVLGQIKLSTNDVINIYKDYEGYWSLYANVASRYYKKFKHIGKSEILAYIMFLTVDRKHPITTVSDFFDQLTNGGTHIKNQTISVLRDKLTDNAIARNKMSGPYRDMIIAKTWNAFIKNKVLIQLRVTDTKVDIL